MAAVYAGEKQGDWVENGKTLDKVYNVSFFQATESVLKLGVKTEEGNLANWIIPGKKMPGMGGAMDLCVGAKHCIICMEHTAKGNPKIFEKCRLPLTASHCVNKIITEMCVLEVTPDGLLMTEINPEFTVDQVKAATAAPITVSGNLKSMID